jgi:hypothetical protein
MVSDCRLRFSKLVSDFTRQAASGSFYKRTSQPVSPPIPSDPSYLCPHIVISFVVKTILTICLNFKTNV